MREFFILWAAFTIMAILMTLFVAAIIKIIPFWIAEYGHLMLYGLFGLGATAVLAAVSSSWSDP